MNERNMTLQEAARIMGSDDSTEEQRRMAAKILGAKGGANSHGGGRPRKNA